jgi:protein O-mannosyl-transferase
VRDEFLCRGWTRSWRFALLLTAATIFAYYPAWHAGFIWDDDIYVTGNPLLTAPDGLWRIWFSLDSPSQYFPLTYSVFRFEHALWGFNPAGYHWLSLILHSVNALLLWRLLRRLALPGAWLAAALFALHPVQVESVAWVTELKNVLSLLFSLLAMLAWVEFVEEHRRPLWRWYLLALAGYSLALFSKSTACTLPAALVLILWLKRVPLNRLRLAKVLPFLAFGLGMGVLAMWWERYHQGTHGQLFALGPLERLLVASRAIWFYAGKLAWPASLAFSYPRWTISTAQPLAYGWLAACVCLAAIICLVRRTAGRGVETAVLFYVATLSPMLGFIMLYTFQYSFVADHYQYIASIGPAALVAAALDRCLVVLDSKKRFIGPVLCATLLFALGVLTWRQSATFTNLETLWRATLSVNPDSPLAHNNLGNALLLDGRVDEAITHFQIALKNRADLAETHNNLGNALLRQGQINVAMAHFQRALELDPGLAEAHNNLGALFLQKGMEDEALAHFEKALQFQPDFAEAANNLGKTLLRKGRTNEAIACFHKALELRPDLAEARNNLAKVLPGQANDTTNHLTSPPQGDRPEVKNP